MASDSQIGLGFIIGLLLSFSFLIPLNFAILADILVIILAGALYFVYANWVTAYPNQWMLLIDNGKLINCGIGLRTMKLPWQQVVKFPSTIQQVEFSATNITLEKQGLELKGVCIWSVYRNDDGPFKFYKYSQGADANSTVKTTCESILRSEIANNKLMDVMQKRIEVRDKMKVDLQKQVTGWGIYVETVELTEVRICSTSVFTDLQADFRQKTHLEAEKIKQQTNQQLTEVQLNSDQQISETRATSEIEKDQLITKINIQKEQVTADFSQKQMKLEEDKKTLQQQLDVLKQQCEFEVEQLKVKNKLGIQLIESSFQLENAKKWLELDKLHDEQTIRKYYIDQLFLTYNQFPLQEIVINQYQQKGEGNSLFAMLPGINEIYQSNQIECNK